MIFSHKVLVEENSRKSRESFRNFSGSHSRTTIFQYYVARFDPGGSLHEDNEIGVERSTQCNITSPNRHITPFIYFR